MKGRLLTMMRDLIRSFFTVEDDLDEASKRTMNTFVRLLGEADRTKDKVMYDMIVKETRSFAEGCIADKDPLGYVLLAEWFSCQKDDSKAILCYLLASENGVSSAKDIIMGFEAIGRKDERCALLMAESFFLIGKDDKGTKLLHKAKRRGFKAADLGISIRNRGNIRKPDSFDAVGAAVSSFDIRLFKNYIIDCSAFEGDRFKKSIDFCRGFAFAKGAEMQVDEDSHTVELTHSYKERVLTGIKENIGSEAVRLPINCPDNTGEALDALIAGVTVIADYTGCPDSEAKESFDILSGACFGLDGELDREGQDTFVFKPGLKEYAGERNIFVKFAT